MEMELTHHSGMPPIKRLSSITTLPALLGAFVVFAFAVMGALTWRGYSDLEIGGPYYQRMIDDKALFGEMLPPPEYLMEAYLEASLAYQARLERGADKSPDPAIDKSVFRLRQLRQEYDRRLEYWSQRPLPPDIRRQLAENSAMHAQVFWKAVEESLLPALQSGDANRARAAYENVRNAYESHRTIIDGILRTLARRDAQDEADVRHRETVLVVQYGAAFVLALAAVVWIMLVIRGRVAQPVARLTVTIERLAAGEYPSDIPYAERGDELGQIAKALSDLKDAMRERAQLSEEKDRFSEVLAHHVQEPVRLQQVYADLLKSQLSPSGSGGIPPDAAVSLGRVLDGANRLRALISDVQTYVTLRPLPAPQTPCDVDQAFDAALAPFAREAAALGATVSRTSLGRVMVDPVRMINIFSMLIDNALKYRHPARLLHVRAEAVPAGTGVILTVTDNGIGIAPEYRERVFKVFERLHNDPDIPGTGIGLALVRKMAVLSKGTVWIEAGDDGGCRVCLSLPSA